jgi:hypothetical protein
MVYFLARSDCTAVSLRGTLVFERLQNYEFHTLMFCGLGCATHGTRHKPRAVSLPGIQPSGSEITQRRVPDIDSFEGVMFYLLIWRNDISDGVVE